MPRDLVIYIHGVSPGEGAKPATESSPEELEESRSELSHGPEYQELREGVGSALGTAACERWREATTHCYTEWGWEHEESDASNLGRSHRLSDAQHYLGQRIMKVIAESYRFSVFPQRPVRALSLYGLSDVFYYVSADGNRSIRARISQQIAKTGAELLDDRQQRVFLTVIGHSAGSVIALDLVSYLFGGKTEFFEDFESEQSSLESEIDKVRRRGSEQGVPFGFNKNDHVLMDTLEASRRIEELKSAAGEGRLALKLLCTMGSPISMLAFRSDDAIGRIAYQGRLPLQELGITRPEPDSGETDTPRWINIWDRHDPISFPIAPLVEESPIVEDHHLTVSWNPLASHTSYWSSAGVHRLLAEHWSRTVG